MGFESVAANSLDVSSDRDFLVEFVFCLSLIAAHLSTWAEEWIVWFTTEFSFISLPDAYTTGFVDHAAETQSGCPGTDPGPHSACDGCCCRSLLILIKSLPMAYNRDLQEDKLALFTAYDALHASLELAPSIIAGAELNRVEINSRIEDGFLDATALMEYMVKKGVPMRTGHETVGRLVSHCEARDCRLSDLPLEELREVCDLIEEDVKQVLGTQNALNALQSYGSGGPASVNARVTEWKTRLA
jgi:argininosuccinate lyase